MGNRNSSSSKVHGQVTRVASTELGYDTRVGMPVAKFRDEYMRKPKAETPGSLKGHHGTQVYSEQQRNAPLDNDETFTSFIRHAKCKIRTVSHVDREQSNVAIASPPDEEANGRDNQNDQFSNFIASAKNKLRSTSSRRRNGSFNIG
uniref:Uncharacterized protein n=1 Tax=Cajanus cajan TaxID=3821 RepID=A0A151TUE0_CAJCA|nr:hypothetical protein KK1_009898 [Cajanus cajan]